ncbi:uncharacterized protein LY89DRAFT_158146 [Mollisia scopiformis]|uniref:Uncharacterized protein n=1 Tax=Mollisia scopiformis TaxID=149040 RepID=A0A194WZN9_MOLSC|nr:uncharacterized protein LY89DRAFT_158146 [Mollisia scopiformis]KUJ13410.1 hypothetical protein LY89DRAFT_158146 [Mollisia scopiformis]
MNILNATIIAMFAASVSASESCPYLPAILLACCPKGLLGIFSESQAAFACAFFGSGGSCLFQYVECCTDMNATACAGLVGVTTSSAAPTSTPVPLPRRYLQS